MARARNIKPGFFKNEILGVADPLYSLLFEGLWVLADRQGRLEDRPLRIKGELFPYRDGLDVDALLSWLHEKEFIARDRGFIRIINHEQWYDTKHLETINSSSAARRARKRNAVPVWANKKVIRHIYAEAKNLSAQSGIPHHVDHDIPLVSDKVCGLHVEKNLRIVPAISNLKKSNKFEVDNG